MLVCLCFLDTKARGHYQRRSPKNLTFVSPRPGPMDAGMGQYDYDVYIIVPSAHHLAVIVNHIATRIYDDARVPRQTKLVLLYKAMDKWVSSMSRTLLHDGHEPMMLKHPQMVLCLQASWKAFTSGPSTAHIMASSVDMLKPWMQYSGYQIRLLLS
jgi:hypothetical protein